MGFTAKTFLGVVVGVGILFVVMRFCTKGSHEPGSCSKSISTGLCEEWREYRSPSKRFVVKLPTPPQHAAESVAVPSSNEKIRHDVFLAQAKAGTIYIVNIIDYPPSTDVSDVDAILMAVIKEIAAGNPANKILKTENGTFAGRPSMDFVIGNPSATIRGRAVLRGSSLFVLTVADQESEDAETSFEKLSNSFRILEE